MVFTMVSISSTVGGLKVLNARLIGSNRRDRDLERQAVSKLVNVSRKASSELKTITMIIYDLYIHRRLGFLPVGIHYIYTEDEGFFLLAFTVYGSITIVHMLLSWGLQHTHTSYMAASSNKSFVFTFWNSINYDLYIQLVVVQSNIHGCISNIVFNVIVWFALREQEYIL